MNLSFSVSFSSIDEFLNHWAAQYGDLQKDEEMYSKFVGKPLTSESRRKLYEWKNGLPLSTVKAESVEENYPLYFDKNRLRERFLNPDDKRGGEIWNIFYMHCIDPDSWPIFDQHVYRAMHFMKNGRMNEIPDGREEIFNTYEHEYVPCFRSIDACSRKIDRALMTFGRFLKPFDKRFRLAETLRAY